MRSAGVAALAMVLLTAGCGDGSADGGPAPVGPPQVRIVLEAADASAEELDRVAAVARARLDALGLEGRVDQRDGVVEVRVDPELAELVRSTMAGPGRFEVRPVIGSYATEDAARAAALTAGGDAEIATDTSGEVLVLGDVVVDGDGVEGATVAPLQGGDGWTLQLVLAEGPAGIDTFNDAAAECASGGERCPGTAGFDQGRLALLLDGEVLAAPTVNAPSFERDQISISGAYSEDEARALAATIRAGSIDVRWSVRG